MRQMSARDAAFIKAGNEYRDRLLHNSQIGCFVESKNPVTDPLIERAMEYWCSNVTVDTNFSIRLPVYGWVITGWMPREYEYSLKHFETLPIESLRNLSTKQLSEAIVILHFRTRCKSVNFAVPPPMPNFAEMWINEPATPTAYRLETKTFEFQDIASVTEFTPGVYAEYERKPEWFDRFREDFARQAVKMMEANLKNGSDQKNS